MIELPGQILALFAILLQVGFALPEPIFHALQSVLNGRDGAESTIADVGVIAVLATDGEIGAFVKLVDRDGKPGSFLKTW